MLKLTVPTHCCQLENDTNHDPASYAICQGCHSQRGGKARIDVDHEVRRDLVVERRGALNLKRIHLQMPVHDDRQLDDFGDGADVAVVVDLVLRGDHHGLERRAITLAVAGDPDTVHDGRSAIPSMYVPVAFLAFWRLLGKKDQRCEVGEHVGLTQ